MNSTSSYKIYYINYFEIFGHGQHVNLKLICHFIVSVYTPAWLKVFYKPAIPEGPQIILDIRNNLLDAADACKIPESTMKKMKKSLQPMECHG